MKVSGIITLYKNIVGLCLVLGTVDFICTLSLQLSWCLLPLFYVTYYLLSTLAFLSAWA